MDAPETSPPSPKPVPQQPLELSSAEYLVELGRRLKGHAKGRVIGVQATREVEIAAVILTKMGEERMEGGD
jgi:hypothetical protein